MPPGDTLYVYALLSDTRRELSLPDARMELVRFGNIAAVVEPRRTRPAATERALRKQHRIVQELHEVADAILPVRFGALVERGELGRIIDLRRGALLSALRHVRGKVQMTLRVFGPATDEPRMTALGGTGTDYLKARAAATRPVLSPAAEDVQQAVRALITAERVDPGRGALRCSIHHLVGRARVDDYQARVNTLIESTPELVLSGPWPPFAFTPDLLE